MATDPREGLFEFSKFKGLRNVVNARDFDPGDLEVALNVDIDAGERVTRRKGFGSVVVAGVDRGLFASGSICLGVGSNALVQISPDWSKQTLHSGLTPNRDLSYAALADRVYYSNGVESGVVQNGARRSWGLTVPSTPAASVTGGDLQAGRYQFAVTYLRNDGQESGAGRAGEIELSARGGVLLSSIPASADPTVVLKAVYMTTTNGQALLRVGVLPNSQTTFTLQAPNDGAAPLGTQFLAPPPPGDHIGYSSGYALVAVGAALYPSEPYAPELFDLRKRIPFTDRITMIAPVDGGLWVGTDSQVLWLAGKDMTTWEFVERADYGAIPGTLAYGDGELIGDGSLSGTLVPFFATKRGICIGTTTGSLQNLTESRFAYPSQPKGAGLVRRHRGVGQYIATLNGPETAGNTAA